MSGPEEKDVQAFNDLQRRLIETTEKQKYAQQQLQAHQQAQRRAELTVRELESLSGDTPVYQAAGKAYYKVTGKKAISELQDLTKSSALEINTLKDSQASLAHAMNGIEIEIRELLRSSKPLAEALAAAKGF